MNCQKIASDIYDFAQLLVSHSLIQDAKSLYDAAGKLQNSSDTLEWIYECDNIKFSIEGAVSGTIPQQISFVEIIFSFSAIGTFSNDEICKNPLSKLNFDIELEGFREFEGKMNNYFASWHLDKHIKSTKSSYIHPEYHLTFGGNKLEGKGVDNFGATLILPSPRIAYPPMDVVLGIDFILQNYFPLEKISKLLVESKYKEIIFNAQQRLWKPYYYSLSSTWNRLPYTKIEEGFNDFNLNPHIHQA